MKKAFTLILIAIVTLFSGVILSSCGEDNSNRTVVVTDASGLCDVRVKNMSDQSGRFLQGDGGSYVVANHTNLKIEINAVDFGVDLSDLEVLVNNSKLEKGLNLFDTDRKHDGYSPIPGAGSLYYGYFTIPYIESNVTIKLNNVKKVSSTFKFEAENLEATQEMLQETQINVSSTEEEEFMSFYEFLTDKNIPATLTRDFDMTLEPETNTYRTFRFKFDGVDPFNFSQTNPFKVVSGEDVLPTTLIKYGNQYILDLGADVIGAEKEYVVQVDFTDVTYNQFEIILPQENQTYSIEASESALTVKNIQDCVVNVTKTMEQPVSGIVANYENMKVLANGTELEYVEDGDFYKFPETVKSPYTTEFLGEVFNIDVTGITYSKDGEEITPNSMTWESSNTSISQTNLTPVFYTIDENGELAPISGIGENEKLLGFEGMNYAVAWQYEIDENVSTYRTLFDLFDMEVGFKNSEEPLFNLKEILPEDTSSLEDNVFIHQFDVDVQTDLENSETRHYTLKATYNPETEIFDKFELQFVCTGIGDGEMEFLFTVKPYEKTIDISLGFEDEASSYRCAIFDSENNMVGDGWRTVDANPLARAVRANYVVAFEIIMDENDLISKFAFSVEDPILANLTGDFENIETEQGKVGFIIKFAISDIWFGTDVNRAFKLIRNV